MSTNPNWAEAAAEDAWDSIGGGGSTSKDEFKKKVAALIYKHAPKPQPDQQHEENTRLISEEATVDGMWGDRGTKVAKEIELYFACFGVTLRPDGTYILSDYSG